MTTPTVATAADTDADTPAGERLLTAVSDPDEGLTSVAVPQLING